MARISFDDLSFENEDGKVKVSFLRIFRFYIPEEKLKHIADFSLDDKSITFKGISKEKAERKLYLLLEKGFKELRNSINGKRTIYVHKNSGIPLIGNVSFGIIDRNTNVIEIKPITGCSLRCIYCSVDEDKRPVDFVVEKDYLIGELKGLIRFKKAGSIEAHIASQGEPMLYSPLSDLIRDISGIKAVSTISIDTNGVLLTKKKVDELVDAGLTRFNFSLNALDEKISMKIAGTAYSAKKAKEICSYISKKDVSLIITPVLVPGVNETEIPKIIEFAVEIGADIGIQNFLNYRMGRNPVKQISFDRFYEMLRGWQGRFDVKLIKSPKDFMIVKTKPLPKPFRKGDIIEADIVCPGRVKGEMIAVAEGRSISIPGCRKNKGKVRLKITRSKHNIFIGACLGYSKEHKHLGDN
ncbi:radical SAM protein [Candidatus Woesearchaeota archaeon]|nr:radical SAM protein [Candidatus Woesearchaeota archaeon]